MRRFSCAKDVKFQTGNLKEAICEVNESTKSSVILFMVTVSLQPDLLVKPNWKTNWDNDHLPGHPKWWIEFSLFQNVLCQLPLSCPETLTIVSTWEKKITWGYRDKKSTWSRLDYHWFHRAYSMWIPILSNAVLKPKQLQRQAMITLVVTVDLNLLGSTRLTSPAAVWSMSSTIHQKCGNLGAPTSSGADSGSQVVPHSQPFESLHLSKERVCPKISGRQINLMNIEKSPYSQLRWRGPVQKNCPLKSMKHSEVQGRRNIQKGRTSTKQTIKQEWQSLKCSGTINSNIYDSNYSITNYPLTSSAPYSSYEPV